MRQLQHGDLFGVAVAQVAADHPVPDLAQVVVHHGGARRVGVAGGAGHPGGLVRVHPGNQQQRNSGGRLGFGSHVQQPQSRTVFNFPGRPRYS